MVDLKQLLKISDHTTSITYPYNNPDYLLDGKNFSDSSDDDEQGTGVAMAVSSDLESKEEIDPYCQGQ